jgi:ATP-binding cassette, subfamily B, bacterial
VPEKADAETTRIELTAETLSIYWRHVRVYWPILLLWALGIGAAIGGDIVSPLLYKRFFDLLAIDPIHSSAAPRNLDAIYRAIVWIGAAIALTWIGWRTILWTTNKFENRTMTDLTNYCFAYLQNHSYRFFTDHFAGALVKRVNRFAASFEVIADQCSFTTGQTALRLTMVVGVVFWRNRVLGFVFLAWTLIFVVFNLLFSQWKLKYDLVRAEMDTQVTARLADTIANASNLKLFAGIDREIRAFERVTDEHQRARYTSWTLGLYSDSIQAFSVRGLQIVVLLLAVRFWLRGSLTLGDFVLLRSYLDQITFNVTQLGTDIRKIYEAIADANEMTEILLAPHEVVDQPGAAPLIASGGVVEFRQVRFAYAAGKTVLEDFSLETSAGERVGMVGPSGGGKSTVLKVLARLHDLDSGVILIDGQNIATVTQSSLHRSIAFVPQEPILFHRTLIENIRYSRPEASDQEVIEAARSAHCEEFIEGFPDGYGTLVGERGVKLSGGERQRVAIARAILMDAPILVLDEATSSLDSESEMFIQDSLARLMTGRTVIAVAHRLSTLHKMDRIVVVKDGRIIEQGRHELLVQIDNGVYRQLWNLQSTGFQPEAHAVL